MTGSGKTEVYIQAIEEVVRFGRQAILLVPEISLTPQTVARFRARFDRVAVLHSHMSDVERHEHWRRIATGEVEVVVGARSAIFAPTPHLGLIVLDEEHETTFKQETAPRYHARDVALRRAADQNVPLVLASATPSLESWQRAQRGEYQLVEMPRRVLDLPLPAVRTIDLRNEVHSKQSRGAISRPLHRAMDEALARRRAGDSAAQSPRAFDAHSVPGVRPCGAVPAVRLGADVSSARQLGRVPLLRLSRGGADGLPGVQLRRHSLQRPGHAEAGSRGAGAVSRLSVPADGHRQHARPRQPRARRWPRFATAGMRILLGTQMIAKGLDFPNVTLVGVVNADTALHLPDFRAAERTFQLVTQVAGRTGRGPQGGRVLVQTLSPDAPAIVAAVRHDLAAFARKELPHREALGYPPFASMIRIVIRGDREAATQALAEEIARRLHDAVRKLRRSAVRILGPAPAPMAKLRGNYRYQIQLHSADGELLRDVVRRGDRRI